MEQCLLSDIPAAQFEAVLHNLTSRDYGALRQVSRAVFKRTTQHVPYLILRLSSSSSMQHVQQWCQATYCLQHVDSIHILITGEVMVDVFQSTMRLLSQRTRINELHLLAADVESSSSSTNINITSCVPTLMPLRFFMQRIKTLVVCGVAVRSLVEDLHLFAAAAAAAAAAEVAGWQLQHLTIKGWSYGDWVRWPDLASVLRHLVVAFPMLQQLHVKLPSLHYAPLTSNDILARHSCSWQKSWTEVAATAAVVNAAMCLQHLQQLTVYGVYDIWKQVPAIAGRSAVAAAAAAGGDGKEGNAVLGSILSNGLLPSVSAAAAAFGTLDDLGRWLLQHHPALTALHIGIQHSAWQMSWQRLHSMPQTTAEASIINPREIIASSKASGEDVLSQIILDLSVLAIDHPNTNTPNHDEVNPQSSSGKGGDGSSGQVSTGSSSSSSSGDTSDALRVINNYGSPLYRFLRSLSVWSSRPATDLLCYISSCELGLFHDDDGDGLVDLLSGVTSLKHLKIILSFDSHLGRGIIANATVATSQDCSPMAVMKAISAVQGLQSFTMLVQGPKTQLPGDLLLPLTAAAGGPGSSLKKLHLAGDFAIQGASQYETAHVPELFNVLKQLRGLVDLSVIHCGDRERCRFSVVNLPASLTSFMAENLVIDSAVAANTSAAAAHAGQPNSQCNAVRGMCANLRRLHISCCELSSPSIYASKQLQQLVVDHSSWLGGWTAAVDSWPNVRKLLWEVDDSNELATSAHVLQGICADFNHLGSLSLNVPARWLSFDVLKPVVQYMNKIRYINFQGYTSGSELEPTESTAELAQLDDMVKQDWLLQQFPWASVSISASTNGASLDHSSCRLAARSLH